jgi:hypothetical protein
LKFGNSFGLLFAKTGGLKLVKKFVGIEGNGGHDGSCVFGVVYQEFDNNAETACRSCSGLPSGESTLQMIRLTALTPSAPRDYAIFVDLLDKASCKLPEIYL